MDGLFERLIEIRKYRKLTQEDCANWFGITAASYGRKENGKEGGLGPGEVKTILEKTQIDARWIFGQIEGTVAEADLKLAPVSSSVLDLIRKESERLERAKKDKNEDDLAHRVTIDLALRKIVEKLAKLDRITLQMVDNKFETIVELFTPFSNDQKETRASGE